jgi:hypothetical protein
MAAVQLLSGVMRYAYNRPTAAAQAFHKAAI